MNLAQHSLRVAALEAMLHLVKTEYANARKEAEQAYKENGIKKLAIALPDGDLVGDITVTQPGPSVVMDEDGLLAWVEEHTPTEVEEHLDPAVLTDQEAVEWAREHRGDLLKRRIRPVWHQEKRKEAEATGGFVVDTATGVATKVAEVTEIRPTGAFTLSRDTGGERKARLLSALRAGELADVTTLAISASDGGGQ